MPDYAKLSKYKISNVELERKKEAVGRMYRRKRRRKVNKTREGDHSFSLVRFLVSASGFDRWSSPLY